MPRLFAYYRAFFREFRHTYRTTGSISPSSRALARALARQVREGRPEPGAPGRKILEIGPGTGAATASIVAALAPRDRLDLVELNDNFVRVLQTRFQTEDDFRRVAAQTQILHQPLQSLEASRQYDILISGLPLNNFRVDEVREVLDIYGRLLKPGGTLSFFQYMFIRKVKAAVTSSEGRTRLRGIGQALDELLQTREVRRDWVWFNLPPAWVHHVRF